MARLSRRLSGGTSLKAAAKEASPFLDQAQIEITTQNYIVTDNENLASG